MLKIYKDASAFDELTAPQTFTLSDATVGSTGKTFNLASGTGAAVYQVYNYNTGVFTKITDYTITGDQLTLTTGLVSGDRLIILPDGHLNELFAGSVGASVTVDMPLWLKRDANFLYGVIRIGSIDLLNPEPIMLSQPGVSFTDGVSNAAFTGLTTNALVGQLVCVDGVYVGPVEANTATTVLVSGAPNVAAPGLAEFTLDGGLQFAHDIAGVPGTFAPMLNIAEISTDDVVKFWVRNTYVIPENAANYPNKTIWLRSVEFIA